MDTKQKLDLSLKEALKSGDEIRKRTVRMVIGAVKFSEKDKGIVLDEGGVISIVQKEIKSRRESLAEAQTANRPDLIADLNQEIAILEAFLPQLLTQEELTQLAKDVITEMGAKNPADMGKVMKVLIPKVQGRAAGDQISKIVKALLQPSA